MNNNDEVKTVSAPHILADLLMVWHEHKLPDPHSMYVIGVGRDVSVRFRSRAAFDAWVSAIGCEPKSQVMDQPYEDGRLVNAPSVMRLGWRVSLSAQYRDDLHTELPAQTVTALEQMI